MQPLALPSDAITDGQIPATQPQTRTQSHTFIHPTAFPVLAFDTPQQANGGNRVGDNSYVNILENIDETPLDMTSWQQEEKFDLFEKRLKKLETQKNDLPKQLSGVTPLITQLQRENARLKEQIVANAEHSTNQLKELTQQLSRVSTTLQGQLIVPEATAVPAMDIVSSTSYVTVAGVPNHPTTSVPETHQPGWTTGQRHSAYW